VNKQLAWQPIVQRGSVPQIRVIFFTLQTKTNKQTDRQTDRNHFNRNTTSVVIHLNLHENIRFMSEMIQDRAVDTMAD